MAEKPTQTNAPVGAGEVLHVQYYTPVYGGGWHAFLVLSPTGKPIWVSLPNDYLGKDKKCQYDPAKEELSLPIGTGYEAKDIDFCMGLKMITLFLPK